MQGMARKMIGIPYFVKYGSQQLKECDASLSFLARKGRRKELGRVLANVVTGKMPARSLVSEYSPSTPNPAGLSR